MPDPTVLAGTELILDVHLARVPIELRGTLEKEGLGELSGCVSIERSLADLLKALGGDYAGADGILKQLTGTGLSDLSLDQLAFRYRRAPPSFAQVAASVHAGSSRCRIAVLKVFGTDEDGGLVIGLSLQSDGTPIGDNFLSGLIGKIAIKDLGVYYASKAQKGLRFDPGEGFHAARALVPTVGQAVGRDFVEGLNFSAEILVGGVNLLEAAKALEAEPTDQTKAPAEPTAPKAEAPKGASAGTELPPVPKDATFWIKVGKTLGPLTVARVGLGYRDARVLVKLDAGLKVSSLALSLEGFGLSYPLDKLFRKPKNVWDNLGFHLDGAGVAFEGGPIRIGGGLIRVVRPEGLQLDGALVVGTPVLTISAIASYANLGGTHSFFAFAAFHKELGGPPFFFVTGLAFGLGINRRLLLPPIEAVHRFPLLRAAIDPDYPLARKDLDKGESPLRAMSAEIGAYIAPAVGDMWVAAGVRFRSFGMIESVVLLSVAFGTRVEIGLLGLSRIQVPPQAPGKTGAPLIAYAELALKVVLAPEAGLLSVEARLTENSYILRQDFKLRGGFAFYSWFAGDHEGDFVISLGGYHPRFLPPAHYPRPDLVAFNCKVGDVTISGSCYFALCPAAIMAGGSLSIVYQSGGVRAWLIAYADFLIQWKPVYYDIAIGVSVGVALNLRLGILRIRLTLELGAAVALYGPPLGGKARISLWIVSFTVYFGAARQAPPPLVWESDDPERSFAKSFLPNPDVIRISIVGGLLEEVPAPEGGEVLRIVDPHTLVLRCVSQVPATSVWLGDEEILPQEGEVAAPRLGVRPMGKTDIHSRLDVVLEPDGNGSGAARQYLKQYLHKSLVIKAVPVALWGGAALAQGAPPAEQLIPGALVGIEIRTREGPRPWQTPVLKLAVLAYDRCARKVAFASRTPIGSLGAFGDKTLGNTIGDPAVVARRRAIVALLRDSYEYLPADDELSWAGLQDEADEKDAGQRDRAGYLFQAMPVMARVGQYPPRGYLEV